MSEEVVVHRMQVTPWDQMREEAAALGRSGLFPHIDSMEKALAICLLGRDLGLTVSQSIYGINVIKGRPSLSANIMQQLIIRHHGGNALYYKESTPTSCTLEYKRKDADRGGSYTYTIEDARRADLTGKDVWKKDPAAMLRARALSIVARMVFADTIGGSYLAEEMEDVPASSRTTVERAAPPPQPPQPPQPQEEAAEFTVVNEYYQEVNPETGEVKYKSVDPPVEVVRGTMSDMQRQKIRTMQAELGYTLEVKEMSYEEAAAHIIRLAEERDKRAEAAKPKRKAKAKAEPVPNVEERDLKEQETVAEPAPPAPVQAPALFGQEVPATISEMGTQLVKARNFMADLLDGFPVYLSPKQLTDTFAGADRRERLLLLYNHLVAGKDEGKLEPFEVEGIGRLLQDLRGHKNIPAIVSHQSCKSFVQELLEETRERKAAAELAEFEAMPTPSPADQAKDQANVAKAMKEQTATETKEKNDEPDPLWDAEG